MGLSVACNTKGDDMKDGEARDKIYDLRYDLNTVESRGITTRAMTRHTRKLLESLIEHLGLHTRYTPPHEVLSRYEFFETEEDND